MKRSFRHLTPRYIVDRIKWELWMRSHPDTPWLTPRAVAFLEEWLRPKDRGIEWGSGRSTVWFAKRIRSLLSVEHSEEWYQRVKSSLDSNGLTNVDYQFVPLTNTEFNAPGSADHPYVMAADKVEEANVDFALVDGSMRGHCARLAMTLLKPGGLLILDDAHWYLPHVSHSPKAVGAKGSPKSDLWADVWQELKQWRLYWTTNGCQDTALFFRP